MENNQIEQVRARITAWRKEHETTKGRRLPEEIWESVRAMTMTRSPNEVARAVGLNSANIYRRLAKTKRKSSKNSRLHKEQLRKVKFFELGKKSLTVNNATDLESKVELVLEKPTGEKLHLRYPESCVEQLSLIIDQFLKAA